MAKDREARIGNPQQARAANQTKVKDPKAGRRPLTEKEDSPPQDSDRYDIGPWAETPASSRVKRYRYDYMNRAVQVQWRNGKNHGYVYEGVPYEVYRLFARNASKGRYINSTLNSYPYGLMDADEVNAPSNESRHQVSRAKQGT